MSDPDSPPPQPAISRLIGRFNINEFLTLLVASGSLAVSGLSYCASRENGDIKQAITNLSTLAEQTKREADIHEKQLGMLSEQISYQKEQTGQIAAQTVAITKSADAQIRSSTAQKSAADTQRRSQEPLLSMSQLWLQGFKDPADDDDRIALRLKFNFRNEGGAALVTSIGSNLLISANDPVRIPQLIMTRESDVSVSASTLLLLREPMTIRFHKTDIDAVNAGRRNIYLAVRIKFKDVSREQHDQCFIYKIKVANGEGADYFPLLALPGC